jgi:hypothetical protein
MTKVKPRFFVHRADPNRVLLLAIAATPQVPLAALARLAIRHFVDVGRLAVNAGGSIAPTLTLQKLHGDCLIAARERDVVDEIGLG